MGWVDVLTGKEYRDVIIDNLKHCQENKGVVVYGWCIMSNHIHLIISAKATNVSDVLGDFKKFTGKKLISTIVAHSGESRREWMIKFF